MIVTFYSYKGGVGRSMAMANVANWLRLQGLKVAVLDWDLEAPGLECFFLQQEADRTRVRRAAGLLDLVETYRRVHGELPMEFFRAAREADPDALARQNEHLDAVLPDVRSMLLEIAPQGQASELTGGPLFLLGPGIRDGDNEYTYARDVQALDWGEFYEEYDGPAFFSWLRSHLEASFDITLIDSRTGMTEVGGICTREMADLVVCLCAPNTQNLRGCALMLQSLFGEELIQARGGRPLDAMVVPARYDNAESDLLRDFERRFRDVLTELRAGSRGQFTGLDSEAAWGLRIRYTPKYAYQEKLCIGAPDANADLSEDYIRLSTNLASRLLPTLSEQRLDQLVASSDTLRKLSQRVREEDWSIERRIDAAVARLSPGVRSALPSLMLRFVSVPSLSDSTNMVVIRQDLGEFDASELKMLHELEREGILVFEVSAADSDHADNRKRSPDSARLIGRQHARLAQPRVLEHWGQLRRWVSEHSEFLVWRKQLDDYAAVLSRSEDEYAGRIPVAFLEQFERSFAKSLPHALSVLQKAFIARCQAAEETRAATSAANSGVELSVKRSPFSSWTVMPVLGAVLGGVIAVWWASNGADDLAGTPSISPSISISSSDHAFVRMLDNPFSESFDKALRQERSGNLTEAVAAYTGVINGLPEGVEMRIDALLGRGRTFWAMKQFQQAYEDLSAVVRLAPTHADARLFRARCGAKLLTEGISLSDADAGTPNLSADLVLADYDAALANSSEPSLYVERGVFRFKQGDSKKAMADFEQAIKQAKLRNQLLPEAFYQLGVVHQALGNDEAALANYEEAISQNPEYWRARYNLALLTSDEERALEQLRLTAEKSPESELRALAQSDYDQRSPKSAAQKPPSHGVVALNYSNPADLPTVTKLRRGLRKHPWTVYRPALVNMVVSGSVRYFFEADKPLAMQVRRAVEQQLKRSVALRFLDGAAFPAARPGTIEVWLPPLEVKSNKGVPSKGMPTKR